MMLPITGEVAVLITKSTLATFGVKGPFRLQRLGGFDTKGGGKGWNVEVTAPSVRFTAWLDASGRLRDLSRPLTGVRQKSAPYDRWLARVRPRFPVRPTEEPGRFEAWIAGHRFLEPTYGYAFRADSKGFAAYGAREDLPRFGPSVPRLKPADAVRLASPRLRKGYPGDPPSYGAPYVADLVWLECEGPSEARLVYLVRANPIASGREYAGRVIAANPAPGPVTACVDAATGEIRRRRNAW